MKRRLLTLGVLLLIFFIFFARMPVHDGISLSHTSLAVAPPHVFMIPKLKIKAAIEYVGLDSNGAMDVPKHGRDVAWYSVGPRPGEMGNAVINGHVDFVDGKPAVFAKISDLRRGDLITVLDTAGIQHSFSVTAVKTYEEKDVPLKQIFGNAKTISLNLITCAGDYDQAANDYTKRVVVYSNLTTKKAN